MTEATIAERVAAGAALMDEADPGWWRADADRAIDLEALDLAQTDMCVLGQRCPLEVLAARVDVEADRLDPLDFGEAYDAYARYLSGLTGREFLEWAHGHGFALTAPGDKVTWEGLTAEWRKVIAARREAAGEHPVPVWPATEAVAAVLAGAGHARAVLEDPCPAGFLVWTLAGEARVTRWPSAPAQDRDRVLSAYAEVLTGAGWQVEAEGSYLAVIAPEAGEREAATAAGEGNGNGKRA